MNRFRILVADDEVRILNFLQSKLKSLGFDVTTAKDGVECLELAQAQAPDLIVLDVLMPRMDGFEVLKQLRTFSSVPVIILSAREAAADKVKGLGMGADDYVPKPFSPDELVARIEAVRRRVESPGRNNPLQTFTFGDVAIDFPKHLVMVRGAKVALTRIEWLLMNELVRNAGRLMTYEELLSRVWGPEYRDDVQILRTWISRLRYKIEKDPNNPNLIRTMPKVGYIVDQVSDQ
ncbi:MAG: response regulator transcription factor [Dehalococcoidales bacterium]|nr:response regulator transcription factor [Dehalococcoidales bacterium]